MTISETLRPLDTEIVRQRFPGLRKNAVCLNNGSGALVFDGVIESIARTMSDPHMNLRGLDSKSKVDVEARKNNYASLCSFMNADPDEIAFGMSTTGLLRTLTNSLRPHLNTDSEMIVSLLCHEAGMTAWVALADGLGISIKWWTPAGGIGSNHNPSLTVDSLRPLLSPRTRLVCCGHVSNITGTIEPIKELAELVHTIPEALICVDGVAWAPHRPIDVKYLNVDFYVFSWYKVFGPHIAQIYARRRVQQRYLTSLNHYFFEPSALHVRLGLGNSCLELEHSLVPLVNYLGREVRWSAIIAHEELITEYLLAYLTGNPDLYTVYGSQTADSTKRVSLISFSVHGIASDRVAKEIHETSECRVISGDCWSPRTVHDVLGLPDHGVLRVSLVHYNTIEEIEVFKQVLHRSVLKLQKGET